MSYVSNAVAFADYLDADKHKALADLQWVKVDHLAGGSKYMESGVWVKAFNHTSFEEIVTEFCSVFTTRRDLYHNQQGLVILMSSEGTNQTVFFWKPDWTDLTALEEIKSIERFQVQE